LDQLSEKKALAAADLDDGAVAHAAFDDHVVNETVKVLVEGWGARLGVVVVLAVHAYARIEGVIEDEAAVLTHHEVQRSTCELHGAVLILDKQVLMRGNTFAAQKPDRRR